MAIPVPVSPDVVFQESRLTLPLSFSDVCSQQATNALTNGLVADLDAMLGAAAVGKASVSIIPGPCATNEVTEE
jgi:hypothetical protein